MHFTLVVVNIYNKTVTAWFQIGIEKSNMYTGTAIARSQQQQQQNRFIRHYSTICTYHGDQA
jgi:hypothetical protein